MKKAATCIAEFIIPVIDTFDDCNDSPCSVWGQKYLSLLNDCRSLNKDFVPWSKPQI
jgi:hypothetical protein